MRTSYVFLCNEQAPREFPHRRFLEVRQGSLKLYSLPERRSSNIQVISMMGMIFGFLLCLRPVSILLYYLPPIWQYLGLILIPVFILWLQKTWFWSVQVAFRYSKEFSTAITDVQPGELKFGFLKKPKLQVSAAGRQTVLSLVCKRRTLSDALQLAAQQSSDVSTTKTIG